LQDFIAKKNLSRESLLGIGIGVPGPVSADGTVKRCVNLGWGVFNIEKTLTSLTGLPVKAGNDANVAALGESWLGGGKGCKNMVMTTLGTGVGGGIIMGGKLITGVNNAAGEIGHMTIRMDGLPCDCGRQGCLERYASATALITEACKATGEPITEAKTVFDRAAAGDPVCRSLLDQYTTYLAEGLANLINIFGPGYVCIGGGVSHAGDALLQPVKEKTYQRMFAKAAARKPQIILARLHNDAGILGAALLDN
jgi:glucokinase